MRLNILYAKSCFFRVGYFARWCLAPIRVGVRVRVRVRGLCISGSLRCELAGGPPHFTH